MMKLLSIVLITLTLLGCSESEVDVEGKPFNWEFEYPKMDTTLTNDSTSRVQVTNVNDSIVINSLEELFEIAEPMTLPFSFDVISKSDATKYYYDKNFEYEVLSSGITESTCVLSDEDFKTYAWSGIGGTEDFELTNEFSSQSSNHKPLIYTTGELNIVYLRLDSRSGELLIFNSQNQLTSVVTVNFQDRTTIINMDGTASGGATNISSVLTKDLILQFIVEEEFMEKGGWQIGVNTSFKIDSTGQLIRQEYQFEDYSK